MEVPKCKFPIDSSIPSLKRSHIASVNLEDVKDKVERKAAKTEFEEKVCLKWPNSRLAVKLTLQLCLTHGSRMLSPICVVEF